MIKGPVPAVRVGKRKKSGKVCSGYQKHRTNLRPVFGSGTRPLHQEVLRVIGNFCSQHNFFPLPNPPWPQIISYLYRVRRVRQMTHNRKSSWVTRSPGRSRQPRPNLRQILLSGAFHFPFKIEQLPIGSNIFFFSTISVTKDKKPPGPFVNHGGAPPQKQRLLGLWGSECRSTGRVAVNVARTTHSVQLRRVSVLVFFFFFFCFFVDVLLKINKKFSVQRPHPERKKKSVFFTFFFP